MVLALIGFFNGPVLATHEGIVPAEAIETGGLGSFKYFSVVELARVGVRDRDLEQVDYLADLDLDFLAKGIASPLAIDTIPSIDEPFFISTEATDEWLNDDQLVLGIRFNGITRAYPLAILNWHEIVNDDFGGTKVVVTYCPLCDSGLAFLAPEIEGQFAEFGTSGRLFRSDLVMYDRVTATFWEQFQGRAIVGPLVGQVGRLHRLSVDIVPYGSWKAQHPETTVLDRPRLGDALGNQLPSPTRGKQLSRTYSRDPYSRYRDRNPSAGGQTQFGVPFNDDRLNAKDAVIGIVVAGQAKAYAREAALVKKLLNDEVNGVPLLLLVTPAGEVKVFERSLTQGGAVLNFSFNGEALVDDRGNVWGFDGVATSGPLAGASLSEVVTTPSFWFAWVSFNPDTELFGGQSA